MDHREQRNEFGLDEYNASDVRAERTKSYGSWRLLTVIAIAAVLGLAYYTMSDHGSQTASRAPVTTGSSATTPQPPR